MLYWALIFLIIGLIAGAFGYRGVASTATEIARVLFFVFIVVFIGLLLVSLLTGGPPPLFH
jgi:uncharacterized membrane protein YtjA (UPF0391 family)